jgi:beta-phosphoglucomutase family hydrolase
MPQSNRGVIFDMDGVLVLSEQAHWESWRVPAARRGVALQYDQFLSCFGRINPDCIAIMFGPKTPADESARIADEKEIAFREIVRKKVPLAPGAVELLKTLRQRGMLLAVGSSGPRENIELVLNAGGLGQYFQTFVHGGEVKRGKPAPDVFLLAAERLGVAPENCTVIEDAPAGIQAAVAAGMRAVAVATTHKESQLKEAGASATFPDLISIPPDFLMAPK